MLSTSRGRALVVAKDGALYVSRGYAIYRSDDWGSRWTLDCAVRTGAWNSVLARGRLAARLTRQYVGGLAVLSHGARVAIARDGIYRAASGEREMSRVFRITRGSRPLNLGVDDQDRVLFGEYGSNPERHEVHVYASTGAKEPFEVAYTFRAGDVRHVHNILYDALCDNYWVFVGDYGREPGIGLLDKDFSHLEWVSRGSQEARVVGAIIERDCLVYGTDTDIEQNRIVRLDKATGKTRDLREIQGSSLFACTFGDVRMISTCVEPSGPLTPDAAALYASLDGDRWHPLESYRKDPLPFHLFQFGTIVLPRGEHQAPRGMFSGQAVRRLDNRVRVVEFRKSP